MTSVILISRSDIGGGAAIAAYRLHRALRDYGIESQLAVAQRKSSDPKVVVARSPHLGTGIIERLQAKKYTLERRLTARSVSRELAYFSDDRVPGPNLLNRLPEADVLNLHWVSHFLDYRRFFRGISNSQPLVWTLHDMAPMTGGCHYAMSCDRFSERCGACPLLGSTNPRDLTRRIHSRKAAALSRLVPETTRIVAPSHWLADQARKSSLLGRFDVEVVPNGLDIETFAPRDKAVARSVLGLPQDGRIVLFAANSVGDYRKGMDLLLASLNGLDLDQSVTLAAIGSGGLHMPFGSVSLGRVENPRLMSFIYSAADAFVLPTRADNLPNVLVEAMACAVPCVSFRVGGVPDVVRHKQTGLLAEPANAISLREHISNLLRDDVKRAQMGRQGREVVLQEYADTVVARKYAEIYEQLVEARRRHAGSIGQQVSSLS
ncbi:glycosyltransferase involved in cell wall biosynthesis [Rhodovulum bhavnagarense]|uniref:Glycosyltransferase involved in cell wall biosynthesis n=1 Tax=Rhodovulum bhavnagarense TaxID=992286 RepID=A0A4R2R811_9RHOB|nr:glycosyltransferase [Rhodovulum bhavnagarense]TCP58763.1 glycosyltransferase involved in cell wall biosynthesis [Rhodovulum bhavnagarense]